MFPFRTNSCIRKLSPNDIRWAHLAKKRIKHWVHNPNDPPKNSYIKTNIQNLF